MLWFDAVANGDEMIVNEAVCRPRGLTLKVVAELTLLALPSL